MKSSTELIQVMKTEPLPLCLVGEPFYIQLFINFNIFNLNILFINIDSSIDTFWAENIDLLPFDKSSIGDYITVFCGLDAGLKNNYPDSYDFFDYKSIFENGTFEYNGSTYIVDDVKYVASNPEYMKRAYPTIPQGELYEYLQELSKAPSERRVDQFGQICLKDYYGKYIKQINGKRITINETPHQSCKTIHIFGDSRVSGYMVEDKDLFSNLLQDELNEDGLDYAVINYGIPGREIDRMEYQVKKAHIVEGDIVFIMTGCYEYRFSAYAKQLQFALHMQNIKKECDECSARLCFINLPTTVEMISPSRDEKTITEIYKNYKFCEYTYERVERYKDYLMINLQNRGIYCYDIAYDFNKYNHEEKLLFINMHHYSPEGNKVIAYALKRILSSFDVYDYSKDAEKLCCEANNSINCYIKREKRNNSLVRRTRISIGGLSNLLNNTGRFRAFVWLHGIWREILKDRKHDAIYGAIVMNANPFTKGHRYLVEYASQKVDHLYVFVLSEDKSEFTYDDRLHMVYLGCRDLKNVTVTGGGVDVISHTTFPEYFVKKELQGAEISAYKDIERFGTVVAPKYGITKRFVGEEPFDNVTKQYNMQMKEYLPRFGIFLEEIPRLASENFIISASEVRAALENGEWNRVRELVPQSTYRYLNKMC